MTTQTTDRVVAIPEVFPCPEDRGEAPPSELTALVGCVFLSQSSDFAPSSSPQLLSGRCE